MSTPQAPHVGFSREKRCILTEMPDGTGVVLQLTTKFYYTLNRTAVALWKSLREDEARSVDALATDLALRFEVTAEQARDDVTPLLDELEREGMVARGGLPS